MTTSKSPVLSSESITANTSLHALAKTVLIALLVTFSWGPSIALQRGTQSFDLRVADLLLVAFVAILLIKWVIERHVPFPNAAISRTLFLLLALFSLWTVTSLVVTVTPLLTVRRIVRVGLLFVMTLGVFDLRPSLKTVVNLFSVHILAQSVVAIGQAILQRDVGLQMLGEQTMMAQLGYNVLNASGRLILRVQGLAEHPNLLAITLIAPLLVVLTYLLISQPRRRDAILPIVALVFGAIAVFFTFSRAATLGGCIALIFLLVIGRSRHKPPRRMTQPIQIGLLLIGVVLVGTMLFAYRDVVLSRLDITGSSLEQTSVTERAVQNRVGWEMVKASPLIGVGTHSARARFAEFLGSETRISHTIHNTVLLVSAELGLPAGIVWLTLLLLPSFYTIRHRRTISIATLVYTAALIPYLITDFTSPASYDTPVGSLLHWLLLALWLEANDK